MRLAKYLAHAGVASRRAAEEIIRAGRVTVAGETVIDPAHAVEQGPAARVALDGRVLEGPEPRVVYAVNKPAGVVCTARDTHGRPTIVELIRASRPNQRAVRLYPVGRLDADTTGLILVTNDGELAHRLLHPSSGVARTYRARLTRPVSETSLRALRRGVELDDGPTAPARVRRVASDVIELVIHEGRKRQVRRMCETVGNPVRALERTAFGPLTLAGLETGASRRLSPAEVQGLRRALRPARPPRRR